MSKIILESEIKNDNYTQFLYDNYDIQNREKTIVEIPLNLGECKNRDWNIGVILGSSGSGKSTILRHIGEIIEPQYDYDKPVISNFNWMSEEEVCELFTSVGLSSVPTWLRLPNQLSNGERARLDIAWLLGNALTDPTNKPILIDEYTSVVNRSVARSMSHCLQKFVRKYDLKVILSSCHSDIIEWVQSDWLYNLDKQIDGNVEVEWQIYSDNKEYELFKQIRNNDVLSNIKIVE